MSSNYNMVVHIGMHKTGTTTLQQQFFPRCHKLNYLTPVDRNVQRFVAYLVATDPAYFDVDVAIGMIRDQLSKDMVNLLSAEVLSGPTWVGVLQYGIDHRSPVLVNIYKVFPDAKIAVVIRRQDGAAKSMYRQYLKAGGIHRIDAFYGMEGLDKPPLMSINRFRYLPYINEIDRLFKDRLWIGVFESFCQNPEGFLVDLCDFIGVKLPVYELERRNSSSLGPLGMEISRLFNYFFSSPLNPAGLIPGLPVIRNKRLQLINPIAKLHDNWPFKSDQQDKRTEEVVKKILNQMYEDNKLLDEQYSLKLKQYFYY